MKKEILIIVTISAAFLYSCGKPKKGPRGDRGNKTIVYEVEGQQGEKGEKGDAGDPGPVGLQGPTGEKGEDGESCEVKSEADGALITCPNSVTKIKNGIGCNGTETAEGVKVTCANGETFVKNGETGAQGNVGPAGIPGPQGPAGRDGQLIVVPQPRYSKTCYTYIDSCDECGNTLRYHIFYKVNTMPNGDVLGQLCEGYNVSSSNCSGGRLTQATLVIGDSRYPVAPVASQYTTGRLLTPMSAEITFRGRAVTVQCQGN